MFEILQAATVMNEQAKQGLPSPDGQRFKQMLKIADGDIQVKCDAAESQNSYFCCPRTPSHPDVMRQSRHSSSHISKSGYFHIHLAAPNFPTMHTSH